MKKIILLLMLMSSSALYATEGVFPESTFKKLDYGLYWFGYGDSWEKAVPGQYNAYYDPKKPTMIYVHGWQKGRTRHKNRETFNRFEFGGPDMDLAYSWLSEGYNVGVLYWNQFADEHFVDSAEAKIWSSKGPRLTRWKNSSGKYTKGPNDSVGELIFLNYKENLASYEGDNIRLVGHSLGNQLAIVLAKKVSDAVSDGSLNSRLLPKRIALLDPFYTREDRDYLSGKKTAEVAADYVRELKTKGVLFESYVTSSLICFRGVVDIGACNSDLLRLTAFSLVLADYFTKQGKKHNAAAWHYLWSYSMQPPLVDGTSEFAQSAKSTDDDIRRFMDAPTVFLQTEGSKTIEPSDDAFFPLSRDDFFGRND